MSPNKLPPQLPPSTESKVTVHGPAAAATSALAGQCRTLRPGGVRVAMPTFFVYHSDVQEALLRGRHLTVFMAVEGEQLQVRVANQRIDILRKREDLAPVYGGDFVGACEATSIQWHGPFSADVTASLAVATHDGKGERTEVYDKPPNVPLLRLLARGGLLVPEVASVVANAQARAQAVAQAHEQAPLPPAVLHAAGAAAPLEVGAAMTDIASCALASPGTFVAAEHGERRLYAVYDPGTEELLLSHGLQEPDAPPEPICNFKFVRHGHEHFIVGVELTGSEAGAGVLRDLQLFGLLRPDAPPQVAEMVLGAAVRPA